VRDSEAVTRVAKRAQFCAHVLCACCLVPLTGTPATARQLFAPSSIPPELGGRPFHKSLPRAWMRLAITVSAGADAAGRGEMTSVELVTTVDRQERRLSSAHFRTPADVESLLKTGVLTFVSVPTEEPLRLRLVVSSKDGAVICAYERSYVLHFPDHARTAALGLTRALDTSGYLGDFVVDQANGDVSRKQR
jgi:hypothetical protein